MAAAGLVQVNGSPLRIAWPSEGNAQSPDVPLAAIQAIRFGHPVAPSTGVVVPVVGEGRRRMSCARFRAKALEISNAFRHALGMPQIEGSHGEAKILIAVAHGHQNRPEPRPMHPVPYSMPAIYPSAPVPYPMPVAYSLPVIYPSAPGPVPHRHHGHHHPGHHGPYHMRIMDQSFGRRLHFALTTLGPWEGRAVAFVLGCGIGVLLRMFWVLAVIAYRSIRGSSSSSDEHEYHHILFEQEQYDAEDILVAPPTYIVDEKVPVNEKEESK